MTPKTCATLNSLLALFWLVLIASAVAYIFFE